jgi:hypothetical protein
MLSSICTLKNIQKGFKGHSRNLSSHAPCNKALQGTNEQYRQTTTKRTSKTTEQYQPLRGSNTTAAESTTTTTPQHIISTHPESHGVGNAADIFVGCLRISKADSKGNMRRSGSVSLFKRLDMQGLLKKNRMEHKQH